MAEQTTGYKTYRDINANAATTEAALDFSALPTTGPVEVYVDANRGLDTNPGTRAQPKKNLSALSGVSIGAGSIIALASDSVWTLRATRATSSAINADNWMGAAGNPLLITAYDPAGHTGAKPTISHGWDIPATEWTWDAAMNAWLWQPTAAFFPDAGAALYFGPARLEGTDAFQDANTRATLPPLFADRQFAHKTDYANTKKLWVYAPSTTNPTDYYGGVWLTMHARGAFITAWRGLNNTVVDGLKFKDTGVGIYVNIGSTSGVHTGLVVKNCECERAGLLSILSADTSAHDVQVVGNKGYNLSSVLVRLAGAGTMAFDMHSNEVRGCNRQSSSMAAFYIQTTAAVLGDAVLHHNYVSDAWNGVGYEFNTNGRTGYGAAYDGTAYYFDLSSHNNVAYSNVSEKCHVAFQTNSARTAKIVGHIAIDCNALSTSTDAAAIGSNDITIAHCTYINRLPDNAQLKKGIGSANIAVSNWYENATGSSIRVFNNALYRTAPVFAVEAIRVANEAPTKFVAGNAVSGWAGGSPLAMARAYNGSVSVSIDATAIAINSATAPTMDGAKWFLPDTAMPAEDSPLVRAGVRHMNGLKDADGAPFAAIPTIGAREV